MGTLIPGVSAGNTEGAKPADVERAAKTRAFNAEIPGIVREKADAGRRVHLVSMAALTPADLEDGTHPTLAGYDKMADAWYAALTSVPGSLIGRTKPARLVNPATDNCLDVAGVSTVPGTRVVGYRCTGGRNQSWTATAARELRVYGDRCLEAASPASGAQARIALCTGSRLQQWTIRQNSSILNVGANRCLDVDQSQATGARNVLIQDCNRTPAQRWARR